MSPSNQPLYGTLTPREREILQLKDNGLSDEEIATEVGISRFTVLKVLKSARERMIATSTQEAIKRAKETHQI